MLHNKYEITIRRREPLFRQIESQFRKAILDGSLPAGSRVPSVQELAQEYQTSVFTIQSALVPLVKEGLLERTQKKGTFVRGNTKALTTIGIYIGKNFWQAKEMGYYKQLYFELTNTLQDRKIPYQFFLDDRNESFHATPTPALIEAIEGRKIQGLLVCASNPVEMEWLKKLPIPFTLHGTTNIPNKVIPDLRQKIKFSIEELHRLGTKKIGMIYPLAIDQLSTNKDYSDTLSMFIDLASDLGMETKNSWMRIAETGILNDQHERFGYQQFKELWKQDEKPDGLLVYPDIVIRGAITAILETGAPTSKMNFVFHRNEGSNMICPFKASWVITPVHEVAQAMLEQISKQISGEEVSPVYVPYKFESQLSTP